MSDELAAKLTEQFDKEDLNEGQRPEMTDPQWTEWVLRQLEDNEMFNDNPKTAGLGRLVRKLLGNIVRSVPIMHQTPNVDNGFHAVVGWELSVQWGHNGTDIRTFGEVADVYEANTIHPYTNFPSATCATRAEGRTYRKALALQHVLAAEEMGTATPQEKVEITSTQIARLDTLCEDNDINIDKLIKLGKFKTIKDVPYARAISMIKYINEIARKERECPDNLLGYDSNWRK